jgi:hypothetical protein
MFLLSFGSSCVAALLYRTQQIDLDIQINQMLGVKYINYIPAAIKAELMPLLMTMMDYCSSKDYKACSAMMRSLRLATSRSCGVRTVLVSEEYCRSVQDACKSIMEDWCSRNKQLANSVGLPDMKPYMDSDTQAALSAATDALHTTANLWTAGT